MNWPAGLQVGRLYRLPGSQGCGLGRCISIIRRTGLRVGKLYRLPGAPGCGLGGYMAYRRAGLRGISLH